MTETNYTERFGKNLKLIREFLDMPMDVLAKKSGLTVSAISQIESGKREPSLKSICKILSATGLSFDRMMKL